MDLPKREQVEKNLTWDLSLLYPSQNAAFQDLERIEEMAESMVLQWKGKLKTAENIKDCLRRLEEIQVLSQQVFNYADLNVSVDFGNAGNLSFSDAVDSRLSAMNAKIAFVRTEIAACQDDVLREAMQNVPEHQNYLQEILREKPHQLSQETEHALEMLSPVLNAPYTIYNQAKLSDIRFGNFDADGESFPLDYSLFEDFYEYDERTSVRRAAFDAFSGKIRQYQHVTASAYLSQVQKEKTMATLRGFSSVFDYLLFPQNVTREMYDRQIDIIMEELAPHMHSYAKLLGRIHHLDRVTYADLKLPVDPSYDPAFTPAQAKGLLQDALGILGNEYHEIIGRAFDERWIDFARNEGKSTGGFCSFTYKRNPFILMTWQNRMADVMTLAHELGHCGQSILTDRNQSFFDAEMSTYTVESPSTMNELLLARYLLTTKKDKRFERWVLSCVVGDTYYHNFVTHLLEAAWQREVYRIIDAGGSVQAETLNGIMRNVLGRFWGDAVELTEGAELTWMRQPHYYMGLYSYTYSAGLTIASRVADRINHLGGEAVQQWKHALSAGGSCDPVKWASLSGIDITTDVPLRDTITEIGRLIGRITELTEELD